MKYDHSESSDSSGELPADSVLAEIASLVLFELGESRAFEIVKTLTPNNCYFEVMEQWPLWVARAKGSPEPKHLIHDYPYNFTTPIGETSWIFERTSIHVIFGKLTFGCYQAFVAADLQTQLRHTAEHINVFQLRSLEFISELKAAFPIIHFRIVQMTDTGRRGVLLPKSSNWDVLPIPEISFGPNTRMPSSQLPYGRVSLESFALFR